MKNTMPLSELLLKYEVYMDYSSVASNLVYPMDMGTKFRFHGYVNQEDLKLFLKVKFGPNITRIQNKYAIPCLQVAEMHTIQTYFFYQHDDKTWLISLAEKSTEYYG